jgi:ABC-type polysaccharide/polyol phosphate export permease
MKAATAVQNDLVEGFLSFRAWTMLALDDLASRYSRTVIGPFWMTIAHAFFVFGYAYWSSVILKQDITVQLPYVAAGLSVWFWISSSLVEAGSIYGRAIPLITAYNLPISLHVHRAVAGQFFSFLHNLVVLIVALVIVAKPLSWHFLLALPGMFIVYCTCIGWTLGLGVLGMRYRDIAPLINSIVGMFFILTPIFWRRADIASAEWMADYNPFYHLIEVVREPFLGGLPSAQNWIVATSIAVVSLLVGGYVFATNRNRLPYWL